MADYNYFKQYVSEMERIRAKTAHEEHIVEFRAMCAKMINDAIPDIKKQCMEECRKEFGAEDKAAKKIEPEVEVKFDLGNIRKQFADAFRRAFR